MHWVFLILSNYSRVSQILLFPFISSIFPFVNALRFASALATVNEEKEGENEKPRIRKLSSHTVRALCPNSEMMREKRKERERKRYGQNWEKKKYVEKKGEYGELPFWEYWVLPRNICEAKSTMIAWRQVMSLKRLRRVMSCLVATLSLEAIIS